MQKAVIKANETNQSRQKTLKKNKWLVYWNLKYPVKLV
jgi:hypothetical protein